jgi:hypothetical protein
MATPAPQDTPFAATPISGAVPLTVTFSGAGTSIDFGDGTGMAQSDGVALGQTSHTYTRAGTYKATSGDLSVKITVTGSLAACPNIAYGISCVQGYHAQTNYDSHGCEIQPTCTPN